MPKKLRVVRALLFILPILHRFIHRWILTCSIIFSDDWKIFFNSQNDALLTQEKLRTNKEQRPGKSIKNINFGVDGSFRKLDLD